MADTLNRSFYKCAYCTKSALIQHIKFNLSLIYKFVLFESNEKV